MSAWHASMDGTSGGGWPAAAQGHGLVWAKMPRSRPLSSAEVELIRAKYSRSAQARRRILRRHYFSGPANSAPLPIAEYSGWHPQSRSPRPHSRSPVYAFVHPASPTSAPTRKFTMSTQEGHHARVKCSENPSFGFKPLANNSYFLENNEKTQNQDTREGQLSFPPRALTNEERRAAAVARQGCKEQKKKSRRHLPQEKDKPGNIRKSPGYKQRKRERNRRQTEKASEPRPGNAPPRCVEGDTSMDLGLPRESEHDCTDNEPDSQFETQVCNDLSPVSTKGTLSSQSEFPQAANQGNMASLHAPVTQFNQVTLRTPAAVPVPPPLVKSPASHPTSPEPYLPKSHFCPAESSPRVSAFSPVKEGKAVHLQQRRASSVDDNSRTNADSNPKPHSWAGMQVELTNSQHPMTHLSPSSAEKAGKALLCDQPPPALQKIARPTAIRHKRTFGEPAQPSNQDFFDPTSSQSSQESSLVDSSTPPSSLVRTVMGHLQKSQESQKEGNKDSSLNLLLLALLASQQKEDGPLSSLVEQCVLNYAQQANIGSGKQAALQTLLNKVEQQNDTISPTTSLPFPK